MEHSARQQVTEDLAQLGVKRGSIIWPILALLIAALMLAIYFQTSQTSPIDRLFKEACVGVSTLELASNTPPTGRVGPVPTKLYKTARFDRSAARLA
jgi:hypothetical protein